MGFMQQVICRGDFYLVDGDHGTDLIPGDMLDLSALGLVVADGVTADECSEKAWANICAAVRDYTENSEIYSVERCEGFYGRYSAPGYLDATDWTWGATEQEVSDELNDLYGDQD